MAVRSLKSGSGRKPGLAGLLTSLVGCGILLASAVQAEGLTRGLDLEVSEKHSTWKTASSVFGSGLNVAHPFGSRGPAVKLSTSVPRATRASLLTGIGPRSGGSISWANAYLLVQKRW